MFRVQNLVGYNNTMEGYEYWYWNAGEIACLVIVYKDPSNGESLLFFYCLSTDLKESLYAVKDAKLPTIREISCKEIMSLEVAR